MIIGIMRKITLALLSLGLSACATQPINGDVEPAASRQAEQYLSEAIASFRAGKLSSVNEAVDKSLKLDPGNGLAYNLRALTRQRLGQFEDATSDFQKAIELAPQDATIRNNFGTLLCTQKRYPAAEQNFLFAADIKTNSEPEIAYTNAGLCAQRAGDGEKAWQYFEQAIRINAGQPTSLYHLSRLSLDAGRTLEANTYLQQYADHAPHTAKSLFLAARVEHAMGNLKGVEDYIAQMQGRFPNATELRQARQLIDPITKELAPPPNFPGVVAYEPPPSLASAPVNNPAVAVSTLDAPNIPAPRPLPAPTPALMPELPAMPDSNTAKSEGTSPFVTPTAATEPEATTTPPVVATATPFAPSSPFPEKNGPFPVKGSDWILKQSPSHYTLQILATDDPARLEALIASDVAPDLTARIQFKRHDKTWHNLVLGSYAENSQAQAALNALPMELKALRPWIRPFSSLQRVITESGV